MEETTENKEEKYIELNTFLKINHIADTGGQAKMTIRSGEVLVNKEVEKRNRRKLHKGDVVSFRGVNYTVKEEQARMTK